MLETVFNYVLPIVSFIMAAFFFIKFWKFRDILDDGTIRLIRQVKTMWGSNLGDRGNRSQSTARDYDSGSKKIGAKIKSMVPFGLFDEMTDEEVHAQIMNEDTVKFFLKIKDLVGGEWNLPGMPQINLPKARPRGGGRGDVVPEMKRE